MPLSDDSLDGGSSGSPLAWSFAARLPPVEADQLMHGPAALSEPAGTPGPHHHLLAPTPFAAPLSPLSQEPEEEPHNLHQVPCGYVPHGQSPEHAATRRRSKAAAKTMAAASRQRRDPNYLEKRALQAQLGQLTRELETLEAEKLRLQHVTSVMEQDLGRHRAAGTTLLLPASAADTDADAVIYS